MEFTSDAVMEGIKVLQKRLEQISYISIFIPSVWTNVDA
jgi:hypothetical protein